MKPSSCRDCGTALWSFTDGRLCDKCARKVREAEPLSTRAYLRDRKQRLGY